MAEKINRRLTVVKPTDISTQLSAAAGDAGRMSVLDVPGSIRRRVTFESRQQITAPLPPPPPRSPPPPPPAVASLIQIVRTSIAMNVVRCTLYYDSPTLVVFINLYHGVARQCVHCCKGDTAGQWEMAILGASELSYPEPIDYKNFTHVIMSVSLSRMPSFMKFGGTIGPAGKW